jgi:hypothetical protein
MILIMNEKKRICNIYILILFLIEKNIINLRIVRKNNEIENGANENKNKMINNYEINVN